MISDLVWRTHPIIDAGPCSGARTGETGGRRGQLEVLARHRPVRASLLLRPIPDPVDRVRAPWPKRGARVLLVLETWRGCDPARVCPPPEGSRVHPRLGHGALRVPSYPVTVLPA